MKHEICKPPYSTIGAKHLSSSSKGELGFIFKVQEKDLRFSTLYIGLGQCQRGTLASPQLQLSEKT
jgi:hypothetical protein